MGLPFGFTSFLNLMLFTGRKYSFFKPIENITFSFLYQHFLSLSLTYVQQVTDMFGYSGKAEDLLNHVILVHLT